MREVIATYNVIGGLSEAVATIEEIKRLHRAGVFQPLPDRYAMLRRILISVRVSNAQLLAVQQRSLTSAIQQFLIMEEHVEQVLGQDGASIDTRQLNSVASRQADKLIALLEEIRQSVRS